MKIKRRVFEKDGQWYMGRTNSKGQEIACCCRDKAAAASNYCTWRNPVIESLLCFLLISVFALAKSLIRGYCMKTVSTSCLLRSYL